jgi:hypothetical protein
MTFCKHHLPWMLIVMLLPAAPAAAVDKFMQMSANAAANCQGALPNFEGSIRKRPLGVQNEGTAASFVTCSFVNQYDSDAQGEIDYFDAYFINMGSAAATVTCTGVAGFETGVDNAYISKSITVAPNATVHTLMHFDATDNGGESYYPLVSLSCRIPPGVGINDTYVGYIFNDE